MNLRHIFNRHQEQVIYFLAAVFVGIIVAFYLWGIGSITTALGSSFQAATAPATPQNFDFSTVQTIPFLTAPAKTP
jgi:hypothetical protein